MDKEANKSRVRVLWGYSARELLETFKRAIEADQSPRIEDFLQKSPSTDHNALLYGLVACEISHLRKVGQEPSIETYLERFPNEHALLSALFIRDETVHDWLQSVGYKNPQTFSLGRTGKVYKAVHAVSGQESVITIIPSALLVEGIFDSEAPLDLDYLLHPNITRPTQLVEMDGNLLLITDYAPGVTFSQLIELGRVSSLAAACELVRQAAVGLAQLHNHHRTHGAISPSSLVLCRSGADRGRVKVTSVGLYELANLHLTRFAPIASDRDDLVWQNFVAPECLSGRTESDARSDVYSLGCLLISLILGRLPQSIVRRSELDARIEETDAKADSDQASPWVTSILDEAGGEWPRGFEAILEQTLALSPEKRFTTADELKDALAAYADSEALAREVDVLLAANSSSPALATDRIADAQSIEPTKDIPTKNDPAPSSSSRSKPATAGQKKRFLSPWGKKTGISVVAATIALAVGLAIWMPRLGRETGVNLSEPVGLPDWAESLVELPGPTGDWWFEEIPWFSPLVRAEIARRVGEQQEIGTAIDMPRLSRDFTERPTTGSAKRTRSLSNLEEQLAKLTEDLIEPIVSLQDSGEVEVAKQLLNIDHQHHTLTRIKQEYQKLAEQLQSPETATAFHLRALLQHASGQEELAARDYIQAMRRYQADGIPGLYALCASDYARLHIKQLPDPNRAITTLDKGLNKAKSVALQIECQCLKSMAYRNWDGQFERAEAALADAEKLLDIGKLGETHALRAVVQENMAWTAFGHWELHSAKESFQQALLTREKAAEAGSPRAWRGIYWNKQGLAMVDHFLGEEHRAEEIYGDMLDTIDATLKADGLLSTLPRRQQSELLARRPNLCERLADTYLFGPSSDYEMANATFVRALKYSRDRHFDLESRWPNILALKYKYVIALVLDGHSDQAQDFFLQIETDYHGREKESLASQDEKLKKILERQLNICQSNRRIADGLLRLRNGSDQEREKALIDLKDLMNQLARSITRKNLDLFLLTSEILARSSEMDRTAQTDGRSMAWVIEQLESVLDEFSHKGEASVGAQYLRRYANTARYAIDLAPSVAYSPSQLAKTKTKFEAVLAKATEKTRGAELLRGNIRYDKEGKPVKCRLHTLAVGVSQYQYSQLNLAHAKHDADELHEAYDLLRRTRMDGSRSDQALFEEGLHKKLTNEDATAANILHFIENELLGQRLEHDLIIVSLSGHGKVDRNKNYYFLTHDYDPQKALSSCSIRTDLLQKQLAQLNSNVVLILDACHSGASATSANDLLAYNHTGGFQERAVASSEIEDALERFNRSGKGVAVLSAARESEKAGESSVYGGHGALSAALLEFLRQEHLTVVNSQGETPIRFPEPYPRTSPLTLSDLSHYVGHRVAQLTHRRQGTSLKPIGGSLGGDFNFQGIPLRFAEVKP